MKNKNSGHALNQLHLGLKKKQNHKYSLSERKYSELIQNIIQNHQDRNERKKKNITEVEGSDDQSEQAVLVVQKNLNQKSSLPLVQKRNRNNNIKVLTKNKAKKQLIRNYFSIDLGQQFIHKKLKSKKKNNPTAPFSIKKVLTPNSNHIVPKLNRIHKNNQKYGCRSNLNEHQILSFRSDEDDKDEQFLNQSVVHTISVQFKMLLLSTQYAVSKIPHQQTSPNNVELRKMPTFPSQNQIEEFTKSYVSNIEIIEMNDLRGKQNFQIICSHEKGKQFLYFGELKNKKKNGVGILVTPKCIYQGLWKNDQKVQGLQKTILGQYKGQYRNHKRNGKGEYFWSNGQYYSGEWKDGKKHGSGYWKSSKGQIYIGEWQNGYVSGSGIFTLNTGQKYEGEFQLFLKHGKGKEVFPNGDVYQGSFFKGLPQFSGKYIWGQQKTKFEGQFFQGKREGKGTLVSDGMKFEGFFRNDVVNGEGSLQYKNGNIYSGNFKNGFRDGIGVLKIFKSKQSIKGKWKNNVLIEYL